MKTNPYNYVIEIPSHSLTAPEWERLGNKWEAQAHLTGPVPEKPKIIGFINGLLRKYSRSIVSHYFYHPLTIMYSLEIQFNEDAEAHKFINEYEDAFD